MSDVQPNMREEIAGVLRSEAEKLITSAEGIETHNLEDVAHAFTTFVDISIRQMTLAHGALHQALGQDRADAFLTAICSFGPSDDPSEYHSVLQFSYERARFESINEAAFSAMTGFRRCVERAGES